MSYLDGGDYPTCEMCSCHLRQWHGIQCPNCECPTSIAERE